MFERTERKSFCWWVSVWERLMVALLLLISASLTPRHSAMAGEANTVKLLETGVEIDGLPKGWEKLTFKKVERHTQYSFTEENGRPVILAKSDRSASGLIRHLDLDSKVYQTISWCWKVNQIISEGDVTKKEGDDYAARIYVTFKFDPDREPFWERAKFNTYKLLYGAYPPKRTLNYIWANRFPKGGATSSAYTDRAHMVAVESGKEKVGEWVCEEKNLFADYLKYFGEEPPHISGVAVMTDTDNTDASASAAYADIVLRKK